MDHFSSFRPFYLPFESYIFTETPAPFPFTTLVVRTSRRAAITANPAKGLDARRGALPGSPLARSSALVEHHRSSLIHGMPFTRLSPALPGGVVLTRQTRSRNPVTTPQ